jgi:glycine cleavage system transcriptional repressor
MKGCSTPARRVESPDGKNQNGKTHRMHTQFQHAYVLNVMSDDHPGIISAVSTAVRDLGGNIDAASQTVLGGYFTLIMVVSLPKRIESDALVTKVRGSQAAGLQVQVREFSAADLARPASRAERFVMTAFGKDKPGIISRLSQCLAGKDINITDLSWTRTNDDFVMISELEIPAAVEFAMLQADLEQLGREEGFTVKLQHENVFVATNQLRLTTAGSGNRDSGFG